MTDDATTYPTTTFTSDLIRDVGDIGKVLGDFLDEQKDTIQQALQNRFSGIEPRAVQKVLNAFITLEGTKRPLRRNQVKIPGMDPEKIDFCLEQLEKSRILRFEDGLFELAHDTLALRISEERSASEVAFLEVIKLIRDRRRMYGSTRTLLNANELLLVKNMERRLNKEGQLTEAEWDYIRRSRRDVGRRRIILWSAVSFIFLVLGATTVFSLQQRSIARERQVEAEAAQQQAEDNLRQLAEEQAQRAEAQYNQFLASGRAFMSQSEYALAIQEFDKALAFKEDGEEALTLKAQCEQRSGVRQQFERLLNEGDGLMARGDDYLVDARNRYIRARNLGYNNVEASSKITMVEGRLPAAFDKFVNQGDIFLRVQDCDRALENYRKALRIRPSDADLLRKLEECS